MPDDLRLAVPKGITISQALQTAGIDLTYPCGGRGTCGRCTVIANGEAVKACNTLVEQDLEIIIPDAARLSGQKVLTDHQLFISEENHLPLVEKIPLVLEPPTLDDPLSDTTRLREALAAKLELPAEQVWLEPLALKALPHKLREDNFHLSATVFHHQNGVTLLSVEDAPLYGLAIDIGTTTVVCALCNLTTGQVLNTAGAGNPQAEYGSDVISRIVFTEETPGGTEILQKEIVKTLSQQIFSLAQEAGIQPESIPVAVIGANTVMSHFLLGISTDYLRREPYIPAITDCPLIRAGDLSLPILPWGKVLVMPSISSYVGGDVTAGVIATDLPTKEGLRMLVDVGTNGEMVLAGEGFMIACSCSAGPAFEGSGISCGSRAVTGAIDNVYLDTNGEIAWDVIGPPGTKPCSICGTGLISCLSVLLDKGIIDRSGRFRGPEKALSLESATAKRFTLAPHVFITEDDVLNLIRAKGAIFAGIRVLANSMGIGLDEIEHVYIAGGFGRHLDIEKAVSIGMFPLLGKDSFRYVGNSSLAGTLKVLNNRNIDPSMVAASITNMELSIGNDFMDEFTKACFLPHTELSFEKPK